jgi:tRNA modification GTPase
LLGSAEAGRRLLEGARVVVAGRPNAGKSSLFNALLGRQRAIVTSVAGTTRDILTETTSLGGVSVTLVDTAGLREGRDPIEREGVSRAEASLASADLVLLVVDSMAVAEELEESARLWGGLEGRARLCVINKLDLWTSPAWPAPAGPGVAPSAAAPPTPEACALPGASAVASAGATPADVVGASPRAVPAWWPTDAVWVSARDGEGLQALEARLCAILGQVTWEGDTLTRARHRSLVGLCAAALGRAAATAGGGGSEEYVLADLHEALTALEDLRGVESPDEVLESIFSTFCIGK